MASEYTVHNWEQMVIVFKWRVKVCFSCHDTKEPEMCCQAESELYELRKGTGTHNLSQQAPLNQQRELKRLASELAFKVLHTLCIPNWSSEICSQVGLIEIMNSRRMLLFGVSLKAQGWFIFCLTTLLWRCFRRIGSDSFWVCSSTILY
jgi:hypothetical protein